MGFIAQDWEHVIPQAVSMQPDGMLGLKTGFIEPYLVVGWQQHDATISQLAARIAALEGRQ